MDDRFRTIVETLDGKCRALLAMEPVPASEISSNAPVGGVYLFSENAEHLCVGRTRRRIDIGVRNQFSTNPAAASFAWLIAREATGRIATYELTGSRAQLLKDPEFRGEYENARERIRRMAVRYVHEPEPLKQALLEIYVAIATSARYNDFDGH